MKIFTKQTSVLLFLLLTGLVGMGQNTNPPQKAKPKKGLQVSQEPDWEQIARDNEQAFNDVDEELQKLKDKYDPNKVHDDTEGVPQEIIDMLDSYERLMKVSDALEKLRDQNQANATNTQPSVPTEKKTTDEEPDWEQIDKDNQAAFDDVDEELRKLRDKYDPNKKPDELEGVPQEIIDMLDSYGQLVKTTEMLEKLRDQNEKSAAASKPVQEKPAEPEKQNPPPAPLMANAKGTGQTTGHIADLTVTNKAKTPVRIMPQKILITYDENHQLHAAEIPATTVPPNSTMTIPINGYCADVHTPPVPLGENMTPVNTWIALEPPPQPNGEHPPISIVEHTVPPFSPFDIPSVINAPGYTYEHPQPTINLDPTWPGTETPINGHIDPVHHPETFAPVIIKTLDNITEAFDKLKEGGKITTPFSGNPAQERESVIQQTFWIYMAAVTGKDYKKEDFESKVHQQFEDKTGMNVSSLPETEHVKLQIGVDQFWNVFEATGGEAKVLSEPDHSTAPNNNIPATEVPPTMVSVGGCSLQEKETDTGPKLDYAIADTGTKGKNEKVKEAFQKAIEEVAGIISSKQGSDTVDVGFTGPEMPASAWSLYFPHVVAGQANASAMVVDMKNPTQSAWTTQPLQTKADGSHEVVLTHVLGPDCKSTLIGINFAKVRASSGLKASLNNVEALRVINFIGEIAIDIVIQKGKGTYTKLSKYLLEKTKDMAKDKAKEFIKDQLEKFNNDWKDKTDEEAEKSMDDLLKDIKAGDASDDEEQPGEFLDDWLADMLVEGDGFDAADKIEGDLLDKIDSPIDWAPIKTNTYAIGEGSLDVYVDGNHGLAKAASGVQYKRKELEDKSEAEKGGGIYCDEGVASHITSGTITLKTVGKTGSWAGATGEGIISTGHGIAVASLESFNGMYVIAICDCPTGISTKTYSSITAYSSEENMTGIWASMFDHLMNDVADKLDKDIDASLAKGLGLPSNSAEEVQKSLENAAARAAQSILPCGSKK